VPQLISHGDQLLLERTCRFRFGSDSDAGGGAPLSVTLKRPDFVLRTASILACIGMAGVLIALFAMRLLFSANPLVVGLQVGALILVVWARLAFGWRSFHAAATPTQGGLVTHGPYRYIRHPIYTAVCLFGWAGIVANWSWRACICGCILLLSGLVRIFCEERLVSARYPEYADYASRTWRMIPYVF
jgi:protein-S-isoprenylcysteine O-methyltransferase Ste14